MAAPVRYDWTMANAPVARGERRSLHDILYACLCTGFGDKPAAGWTREWVNATFDKAVFRPGAGTRMYLQIDGVGSPNAYSSLVKAFESMTDIDTGLFPFKTPWTNNLPEIMPLSNTSNTTARPWVLIADDRFFYLFCWTAATGIGVPADSNTMVSAMFFGDIVSRYASDPYGCILGCYAMQAYYGTYLFNLTQPNAASGYLNMPRAYSGIATPISPALIRGGGPGSITYPGAEGVPYTVGGEIYLTRPHINDALANTFRGFVPGLYYPCHPLPFSNFQQVDVNGKQFLSFRNLSPGNANNILISLDDWRV